MIYNKSIEKIFVYPKFLDLVNLPTEGVEVTLYQETRFWLEDVLVQYFNDEILKISPYRIRPWSQVFKVETNLNELYFIKVPASEFNQEARITELVENFNPDITTTILARNTANGSFLMSALEGKTLRAELRQKFDQLILEDSAAKIGKFQKYIREHISDFEQLDIPRWTSTTLTEDCESLIQNSRFLVHTGLSGRDIAKFKSLFPFIQEKLSILTMFDKGLSIDHGDFQDNNIFISEDRVLFMDWADTCISIPSFTIGTYCHSILLAHSGITNKLGLIQKILEKYYFNLLGSGYNELHQCHIMLVHFLYPMICVLKVSRLLRLEDKGSDTYASKIIDYWIRIIISFSGIYRDKSLPNEVI
jgi:hypothetical protein